VTWVGSLIDIDVWGASQVQLYFFLLSSILIAPSQKFKTMYALSKYKFLLNDVVHPPLAYL
jgi:hypothetical protein